MINTVLTNVLAAVTTVLLILSLIQAYGHRSRANSLYAVSLVLLDASFLLYNIPAVLLPSPVPWLIVVMIASGYFLQTAALRQVVGRSKIWPVRFSAYFVLFLSLDCLLWYLRVPYYWRGVCASVMIGLSALECVNALVNEKRGLRNRVVVPAISAYILFFLAHAARIAFTASTASRYAEFMGENAVTTGVFILTILFSIVSWGLFSILQSALLLEERDAQRAVIERLALTDKLTGAGNRNSLEQVLQTELYAQDRYRKKMSAILADIDFFKKVNDTWGHDAGDDVLKAVAQRMASSIRESDYLFRWGGEEFFALLPETDLAGAAETAEKLRIAVSSTPIAPAGKVTVSFGVAERAPGEKEEGWFKKLDQALYRAKQNGRNRVETAGDMPVSSLQIVSLGWKAEWDCGNRIIDSEHRDLVRSGTVLLNRMLEGAPAQALLADVDALLDGILRHFADEEAILLEIGYPEHDAHGMMHKGLMAAARAFRESIVQGTGNPDAWFHLLVDRIVVEHMLKEDVKFAKYLPK